MLKRFLFLCLIISYSGRLLGQTHTKLGLDALITYDNFYFNTNDVADNRKTNYSAGYTVGLFFSISPGNNIGYKIGLNYGKATYTFKVTDLEFPDDVLNGTTSIIQSEILTEGLYLPIFIQRTFGKKNLIFRGNLVFTPEFLLTNKITNTIKYGNGTSDNDIIPPSNLRSFNLLLGVRPELVYTGFKNIEIAFFSGGRISIFSDEIGFYKDRVSRYSLILGVGLSKIL